METLRLYFDDPLVCEMEATVVACSERGVVLDRSAFYPESGGQMADRGTLSGRAVVDVQIDDAGRVHHVIEGEVLAVGERVRGVVDRARRRLHMALHTGQHILSRALVEEARAETVSSRLGETACTIDLDSTVPEAAIARAAELASSVVEDDVVVRAFFPDASELASLPLRRAPKVSERVRIVAIGDFDFTPCGGTHCLRSAQVGLVHVSGVERYKGGTRVTFSAGRRARAELAHDAHLLGALGRELTCAPAEIGAAVDKLRRQLGEAREALGRARAELAERAADELLEAARRSGERVVIASFDGAPVELLRAVGSRLAALPGAVALLAGKSGEGTHVLAVRSADSSFDCGAFLKRAALAAGGRGGGRPERAEGRLPADADWDVIARAALEP
jgi:alanyl-tRNA synthetase